MIVKNNSSYSRIQQSSFNRYRSLLDYYCKEYGLFFDLFLREISLEIFIFKFVEPVMIDTLSKLFTRLPLS